MIRRLTAAIGAAALMLGAVGAVLAATPEIALTDVPDGFQITEYAILDQTFGAYRNPTAIAVGSDGRVYVALFNGRIYAFEDADGDYQQAAGTLFAAESAFPTGLAWHEDALYLAVPDLFNPGQGQVRRLEDLNDNGDALDPLESETFVDELPDTIRGLAFAGDGRLYVSVAADCDTCTPADFRQGAIVRYEADGSGEALVALGLRDAHDLAFFPGTNDLFAPDNGRDDLGLDAPPDELNFVQFGSSAQDSAPWRGPTLAQSGLHYGWPHCWEGGADPGWEVYCTWTAGPLLTYSAHSSPAGMAFHDGTAVPADYANSAFVALRNLGEIHQVTVTPDGAGGYTATTTPFALGFVQPIDVVVGPDGTIYVADYVALRIYAIRAVPDLSQSWKAVTPIASSAGGLLTYSLHIESVGPGSTFLLTDSIPISTTYVADSVWASGGDITETGGLITWQGAISPNTTLSAGFAVQVDGGVPSRTVIANTAVLSATEDPNSPYILQAVSIVDPIQTHIPLALRDY